MLEWIKFRQIFKFIESLSFQIFAIDHKHSSLEILHSKQ